MAFHELAGTISRITEMAGVVVMVAGALAASIVCFGRPHAGRFAVRFIAYRQWLGRSILLGLEFLVAADIMATVTVDPTWTSVGVLAALVGIRTVLSLALAVEVDGRWPWRHAEGGIIRAGGMTPRWDMAAPHQNDAQDALSS